MSKFSKKYLTRGMVRAQKIRGSSTDADVNAAYDAKVAPAVAIYVAAVETERVAKHDLAVKRDEVSAAITKVDQPFRFARVIISIHDPAAELPETVRESPTPTDVKVGLVAAQ